MRSTAQLISYELILSSAILLVVLLAGSLDITVIIEAQRAIWYVVPLFPIFIVFFIGSIAETNRAPFDLAEAKNNYVPVQLNRMVQLVGLINFHIISLSFIIRTYQKKFFNSKLYSQKSLSDINPYWLTGFIDAEGYFTVKIYKSKNRRVG